MRKMLGLGATGIWGLAMSVAIQKGWLDSIPDILVLFGLCVPLVTWAYIGLTHDNFKDYVRRTNGRMALAMFIIIGALIGAMIGWGAYGLVNRSVRILKAKSANSTHVNTFTTREIANKVSGAGPLQRGDAARAFIGGVVDWTLGFMSVKPIRDDPNTLLVTFYTEGIQRRGPFVTLRVPRLGNEYLGVISGGNQAMFNVRGIITEIDYERDYEISLSEGSFKGLSARSEYLTPAQREQFVLMLCRASGQQVGLVSMSKTSETLEFTKDVRAALEEGGLTVSQEETDINHKGYDVWIIVPWVPTQQPFVENLPDMLETAFQKIGIFPLVYRNGGPPGVSSPGVVTIFISDKT
jgi:hypothetical protein